MRMNEEADVNNKRVILKKNEKIRYKDDGVWREGTVISRAGKANGKYDGYYNVKMNSQKESKKASEAAKKHMYHIRTVIYA